MDGVGYCDAGIERSLAFDFLMEQTEIGMERFPTGCPVLAYLVVALKADVDFQVVCHQVVLYLLVAFRCQFRVRSL